MSWIETNAFVVNPKRYSGIISTQFYLQVVGLAMSRAIERPMESGTELRLSCRRIPKTFMLFTAKGTSRQIPELD